MGPRIKIPDGPPWGFIGRGRCGWRTSLTGPRGALVVILCAALLVLLVVAPYGYCVGSGAAGWVLTG